MKIPYENHKGDHKFWRLKFFDSLSFLPSSLSVLADSLNEEGSNKFHATIDAFGEKAPLMVKKQVIPYTYFDDPSRLEETKLPTIDAFKNDLTGQLLDDESYKHAQNMWNELGCNTLRDYYSNYLKRDVNILIDVFESFREFRLEHYKLDPARYVAGPSLSYGALIYMTGVKLELVRDIEMWNMVCSCIRGGLSVISTRMAIANDDDEYDSDDYRSTMFFVDAVNLYGYAMQQTLATGGYKWLTPSDIESFDVSSIPFNSDKGYLIKCDVEYAQHLHDAHDSCPLAPDLMTIADEMLSPYQRKIKETQCSTANVPKLIAHLDPRKDYVLNYRNLQLYLSLGMKLIKIHSVLMFDQSKWVVPYIMFNTEMRNQAKTEFQKMLFKLMNNACFGKQLESPLEHKETIM